MTPRGSTSTIAFDYLEDAFGAGNAFPYTVVIEPPEGTMTLYIVVSRKIERRLSDQTHRVTYGALVDAQPDDGYFC